MTTLVEQQNDTDSTFLPSVLAVTGIFLKLSLTSFVFRKFSHNFLDEEIYLAKVFDLTVRAFHHRCAGNLLLMCNPRLRL